MIIKNCQIVTPKKLIKNGWIEINNSKIISINEGGTTLEGIDVKNNILMPGFIDVHMHGGYGNQFEDDSVEAFNNVAQKIVQEGVTGFCIGNVTALIDDLERYMQTFNKFIDQQNLDAKARCYGAYMEGPFISKEFKGAHNEEWLILPDAQVLDKLNKASGNNIAYVVYAPELAKPGFVEYCLANNIIPSMGHSSATYTQVHEEVLKGVKHITHMHNGMSPYHHRNPGMVNGGLYIDDIMCECITDDVHNTLDVIKGLFKIKTPDHFMIITDCMSAKGLPDGDYFLGPLPVAKQGMSVKLSNGTLAGSADTFIYNVKKFMQATNASLIDLAKVTSYNQAKELNLLDTLGTIEKNKLANLVILDKQTLDVQLTLVEGNIVFTKE